MSIIESCTDVVKKYGEGSNAVMALNHVSMEIWEGEFVAILGDSGSGKSTLLNVLGGLDTVTSGNVCLDGVSFDGLKDDRLTMIRREKVGFVFQDYNLIPLLSVYENIVMTVQIAGQTVDETYVQQLITLLGLAGLEDRLPNQLSGGQQQRVAIARALASRPAIVFADEPTGNLDSTAGENVIQLFRKSVDEFGQTIVMVTHNEAHTKMCDRIYRMKDGELI